MIQFLKKYSKYIKFVLALSLFFFGSLFQYIPIYLFNIDINSTSYTVVNYLGVFSNLLSCIILISFYYKDILNGIKNLRENKFKDLETGFNYWLVGVFVMIISNILIGLINGGSTSSNEESIILFLKQSPIIATIGIAIIGPIVEELVFRKSFRDVFKNKWIYLFASGIIFGALHVILSPINSIIDYLYLVPYCSMGLSFAYMYYKTDNIMTSLSMHIFHNLLNVISTLLLGAYLL